MCDVYLTTGYIQKTTITPYTSPTPPKLANQALAAEPRCARQIGVVREVEQRTNCHHEGKMHLASNAPISACASGCMCTGTENITLKNHRSITMR